MGQPQVRPLETAHFSLEDNQGRVLADTRDPANSLNRILGGLSRPQLQWPLYTVGAPLADALPLTLRMEAGARRFRAAVQTKVYPSNVGADDGDPPARAPANQRLDLRFVWGRGTPPTEAERTALVRAFDTAKAIWRPWGIVLQNGSALAVIPPSVARAQAVLALDLGGSAPAYAAPRLAAGAFFELIDTTVGDVGDAPVLPVFIDDIVLDAFVGGGLGWTPNAPIRSRPGVAEGLPKWASKKAPKRASCSTACSPVPQARAGSPPKTWGTPWPRNRATPWAVSHVRKPDPKPDPIGSQQGRFSGCPSPGVTAPPGLLSTTP